jgi:predicted amidohydrolase
MTRVALFQSNSGIDPEANGRALVGAIEQAAAGGAEILFTPEMSGLLDRDAARAAKVLRPPEEDQVLAACREAGFTMHIAHEVDIAFGCISARSPCWPTTARSPTAAS